MKDCCKKWKFDVCIPVDHPLLIVAVSFVGFEFPQINYRMYNGKKYSIMYGVVSYMIHGREAVCPP